MKKHSRVRQQGKRKLAEAKTSTVIDEAIFLQPWFMPRHIFLQIRTLLPSAQLSRMKYYFEDYGCLRCGRSNVLYRGNGLCETCSVVVRCPMVLALKRRFKKIGVRVSEGPILKFIGLTRMEQVSRRAHYRIPRERSAKSGRITSQ
jgi:hypothetical protein